MASLITVAVMSASNAVVEKDDEGNDTELKGAKKRKFEEIPDVLPESNGNVPVAPGVKTASESNDMTVPITPDEIRDENNHPYVGLVNQAMTCYLNSLLQTLYMTPEFRNAIYGYETKTNASGEKQNIPYQLKKLFVLLQTSENGSLETKDLTTSFGWSTGTGEAYQQHDIQELYKIMFEVLQRRLDRSVQSRGLIDKLYTGKVDDFIKCMNCGRENIRADVFTELSLAVRRSDSSESFRCVEQALRAYVQPELLTDGNKYFCDQCNSLQIGHKGLRITEFPYLLAVHLKRFAYDEKSGLRVKLNDRVSFPDLLNLNEFIYDSKNDGEYPPVKVSHSEGGDDSAGFALDRTAAMKMLEEGQNVYELYSIMIHQGSTTAGHYFAYIKNVDQQKWFCFNDTTVTSATTDDIKQTFGGSFGGWSVSNTSAYMLMYRRVDPKNNDSFLRTSQFSDSLNELRVKWEEEEYKRIKAKEYEESLVTVHVRFNGCLDFPTFVQQFPNDTHIETIYVLALNAFSVNCDIMPQNCRMLLCGNNKFSIVSALDNVDIETVSLKKLNPSKIDHYFLVDVKTTEADDFYEIDTNDGVSVLVEEIDLENGLFHGKTVWFAREESVASMKIKLNELNAKFRPYDAVGLRIILERHPNMSNDSLLLLDNDEGIFGTILAQYCGEIVLYTDAGGNRRPTLKDRELPFMESQCFHYLERKKFGTTLRIQIPSPGDYQQAGLTAPLHIFNCNLEDCRPVINTSDCTEAPTTTSKPSSITTQKFKTESDGRITSWTESVSASCSAFHTPAHSPCVSEIGEAEEGGTVSIEMSDDPLPGASDIERPQEFMDTEDTVDTGVSSVTPEDLQGVHEVPTIMHTEEIAMPPDYTRCPTPRVADEATIVSTTNALARHPIKILTADNVNKEILLSVDYRHLMKHVFEWLSIYLSCDIGQFTIIKHYEKGDDGYESVFSPQTTVKEGCQTAYSLAVKLRSPLKPNEKLIRVMAYNMNEILHENFKFLFEIPASADTQMGDFLEKCCLSLALQLGDIFPVEQLRLRDICPIGAPVLHSQATFARRGHFWSKNVYLQFLREEDGPSDCDVVIVRRWRSETREVCATQEVVIPSEEQAENSRGCEALRRAISALTQIPFDRVEISELLPSSPWSKWPFAKDILQLCEQVRFSTKHPMNVDQLNGKVVYYRDSSEKLEPLTTKEREEFKALSNARGSNRNGGTAEVRRVERPLRIQLSSSLSEEQVLN